MKVKYILVVGSRSITDEEKIFNELSEYCNKNTIIVSGGAIGVDSIAEKYADMNNLEKVIMYADWDKYGIRAGYIRNEAMHKYIAKFPYRLCIAFWDGISKGTAQNFKLAEKYNTPLEIIYCKPGSESEDKEWKKIEKSIQSEH